MARLLKVDPLARVILFSGYADSDLMIRAEELGFKGRLAKPFTTPELAAVIQGVLSSVGMARQAKTRNWSPLRM